jgi:cell division protein ZapB
MLENTLPQLEQLIEQTIENNNQLKKQVGELQEQKDKLAEENELLQLEALENEEKQIQTATDLNRLLSRLQAAHHEDNNEHEQNENENENHDHQEHNNHEHHEHHEHHHG